MGIIICYFKFDQGEKAWKEIKLFSKCINYIIQSEDFI